MRIEKTGDFSVCGKKIWISGQDNELFGRFWEEANNDGTVEKLKSLCSGGTQTGSRIFGVSRVEKDPSVRAFDFYIATEGKGAEGFESFDIKGGEWAVFSGEGEMPMALVNAEMEAFMNWLPASEYIHDFRPELEVYPEDGRAQVEFWLPIAKK